MNDYITELWDQQVKLLEHCLLNADINNFLRWDFLARCMFHIPPSFVLDAILKSEYYPVIKEGLIEDKFGNPPIYDLYPQSSGNLLHHAYSLLQLYNNIKNFNISNLNTIFEFGGGYGSFCRLIHRLQFKGIYIIYDLPTLSKLQKLYLSQINIPLDNIKFINELSNPYTCDLFISLWALEEAPKEVIFNILENVTAKYYLIAFHDESENSRNIEKGLKNKKDYIWKVYKIPHISNSSYRIGEKQIERMEQSV